MNKILAILFFLLWWVFGYLTRILWYDLLHTVLQILLYLFISPLSALWLLITLPIILIIDIPVGLIVTFIFSIEMSAEIFNGEMDLAGAIKETITKNRRRK